MDTLEYIILNFSWVTTASISNVEVIYSYA